MSLKTRAQQHSQQIQQRQTTGGGEDLTGTSAPIDRSFRGWAIVDNELVEVLGLGDIPGASPALLCTNRVKGDMAMVPITELQYFEDLFTALQVQGTLATAGR